MDTETDVLNCDGLVITLSRVGSAATVAWKGTSDLRDPSSFLKPVLTKLAEDLAGNKLTLDFRSLEYMNSATVSSLIHFIRELDAHAVQTEILYDAGTSWQRLSFRSIEVIARSLAHVGVQRG